MSQPVLFVTIRNPPNYGDEFSYLENADSERLWMTVNRESIHPFLREPALLELARRQDSRVIDLCEGMLIQNDPEEWFLAVFTLGNLGTSCAVGRLLHHASQCVFYRKRIILKAVATILTDEYRESFIKLANIFGVPGILDVTGWTPTALSVLAEICHCRSMKITNYDISTKNISQDLNNRSIPLEELLKA